MSQEPEIREDVWVRTLCGRCYASCAIRVHRVNGVAVKIEGEPESKQGSQGGVCGKGAAALQVLYDPNRLNTPLRRTNPEKGLFVDPKWKPISWDEALDEITARIKKIADDDPRKILYQTTTIRTGGTTGLGHGILSALLGGGNQFMGGGGLHCGGGSHPLSGMNFASWSIVPDFRYSNYIIYFGTSKGTGSGHQAMQAARLAAEARARGAKFISFDPMCNVSAGKATEWIPLLPGTDGVIVLAMCNVLVNELGVYDAVYLKTKSNAPYLIGPDGRYVREQGPARGVKGHWVDARFVDRPVTFIGDDDTNKPLVWDAVEGKAKVYDDPTIKDYALEGEYEVRGIKCHPAFHLVREHLKQYTPEMASKVSTVPAATIHRIAVEWAENARVGSTINIQGHTLPFRPVSAVLFRGGQGHANSHQTCAAVALLNHIVGAADVPGGTLGWPARGFGYPETGAHKSGAMKGIDGFLLAPYFGGEGPWPVRMPEMRGEARLHDIFSLRHTAYVWGAADRKELWQKAGVPYRLEMMVSWGCNSVMSVANREIQADCLKDIPFIVVFELFSTEMAEGFADILLPDTCYLEESSWQDGFNAFFNQPPGLEDWHVHVTQQVVPPAPGRRSYPDVLWEIADRLGMKAELNELINRQYKLEGEYKLQPTDRLTRAEVGDRLVKQRFGSEHDWEWFKEHGFITWPKKVEEAYWRYFVDARVPIYLEYMVDVREKLREIVDKIGIDIDFTQYTPFISWAPGIVHRDDPDYDLYCFSYRDILHTGSSTMEQPWLDEASQMNPYTYNITMNRETAEKKGLKDGDVVEIESADRRTVTGRLKVMEGQHPQTMGIAACSGHWAKGLPIAKDKGTNFDILLELDLQHVDPVSWVIETCARVKVKKVSER
ncbi:MAG: molybdopterin-dependent oxidoreductase [Chloroflexi bacterium]|nr:molybdopterin-dependent oxidoreductase [Chloroflexota bacterium]